MRDSAQCKKIKACGRTRVLKRRLRQLEAEFLCLEIEWFRIFEAQQHVGRGGRCDGRCRGGGDSRSSAIALARDNSNGAF